MKRQPVPPRVPRGKYEKDEDEMVAYEKAKGPTLAKTFEEAKARELVIEPPRFTDKHLKTKKVEKKVEMAPITGPQSRMG